MKELLKETRALLRDFELYRTGTKKSLPILDKDIELLRNLIKTLEKI